MNPCYVIFKTTQRMKDGKKQELKNLVTNDNPIPIFHPTT